jgi:hypothetical protein
MITKQHAAIAAGVLAAGAALLHTRRGSRRLADWKPGTTMEAEKAASLPKSSSAGRRRSR